MPLDYVRLWKLKTEFHLFSTTFRFKLRWKYKQLSPLISKKYIKYRENMLSVVNISVSSPEIEAYIGIWCQIRVEEHKYWCKHVKWNSWLTRRSSLWYTRWVLIQDVGGSLRTFSQFKNHNVVYFPGRNMLYFVRQVVIFSDILVHLAYTTTKLNESTVRLRRNMDEKQ